MYSRKGICLGVGRNRKADFWIAGSESYPKSWQADLLQVPDVDSPRSLSQRIAHLGRSSQMEYDVCLICSNNLRLLSHSIKSIAMLSVSGPHAPKKSLHRVKLSKLSTPRVWRRNPSVLLCHFVVLWTTAERRFRLTVTWIWWDSVKFLRAHWTNGGNPQERTAERINLW